MTDFEHCTHCPGPDDPRHEDPGFAKAEADCAFYENPDNLVAAGPGHRPVRRHAARLSGTVPVRFSQEAIAAVKQFSDADGMTVSSWVRKVIDQEIAARSGRCPACGTDLGHAITAAINADPEEVARLRLSRQQARDGHFRWSPEDPTATAKDPE